MAKIGWDKSRTSIEIDGQTVSAPSISPQIISASRSTDIPAFYSDWFLKRLEAGYVVWVNPMNRRPQIVNFENLKFIVFWTKNAAPLQARLNEIDERGIRYYFQHTLNNYKPEFEPGVPLLDERIASFQRVSQMIGKEKVIWRFDPLILSDWIDVDVLINKIEAVGDRLHPYTEKLVFSFVDIDQYSAVRRNLDRAGLGHCREFRPDEIVEFAEKLSVINESWGLELATCGETVDLAPYGIVHNQCIDAALISRICADDRTIVDYIRGNSGKDKGQREACGCIPSKDIGMYNTCMHQCVYCYANHRNELVRKNAELHRTSSDAATITDSPGWQKRMMEIIEKENLSQCGNQRVEQEQQKVESDTTTWNWEAVARNSNLGNRRSSGSRTTRKRGT